MNLKQESKQNSRGTYFARRKGNQCVNRTSKPGNGKYPTGFAGGFTGEEIRRLMKERKIEEQFVRVKKGISRINVKLAFSAGGREW